MSSEERIYTVPLGKTRNTPKYRRAEKAVTLLRQFTQRHMKPEEIIIDPTVNEEIWARGIRNPPRKIRVRMTRDDDGIVTVTLAEAPVESEEPVMEELEELDEEVDEREENSEEEPEEGLEEETEAKLEDEEREEK